MSVQAHRDIDAMRKKLRFDFSTSINNFIAAIRDPYFWIWFLPFITFAVLGVFILFAIFNYDKNYQIAHIISSCRKLTDAESMAMLLTLFLSFSATLLTLGELFIFIENKKRNRKITYLNLTVVACMAILSILLALYLASSWCR